MGTVFVLGGISHVFLGQLVPDSYAVFATTPPFEWMRDAWQSFALPNIRWLTVLLAAYEIVAGVLLFLRSSKVRVGAAMMLVFLALITLNGYGFETSSVVEDFSKNRVATLIMAISLVPLLLKPQPPAFLNSFRIGNHPR